MIQILKREQYNLWNSFIRQNNGSFLQSSEWPAENFFIYVDKNADGKIMYGCKIEERTLWLGKVMWLVRRHGTRSGEQGTKDSETELLNYLVEKAKEQGNVVMIRIQLPITDYQLLVTRPRFLFHIEDPATTLLVDLSSSEDELMSAMHEKTRYNIRLAEKKGVVVREGGLDEFYSLYSATNQRKGLKGFSKEYFQKMINVKVQMSNQVQNQNSQNVVAMKSDATKQSSTVLGKYETTDIGRSPHYVRDDVIIKIFTAYNDATPLASNLLVCFGDTVTYLFGGTSDEHRELMAPHLLHWECIKWAKANGYHYYDFWGIRDSSSLPPLRRGEGKGGDWAGITRFKKGFVHAPELRLVRDSVPTQRQDSISKYTGRVVEYGETVDVVVDWMWYWLFTFAKKVF